MTVNSRQLLLTVAVLVGLPGVAFTSMGSRASAGEGEKALSLVGQYSTWAITEEDNPDPKDFAATGATLGFDYERGWNDTLWLRASVAGGYYDATRGRAWSAGGTIGITYALDVLRYVPYVNVGAGALVVGGSALDTQLKPVVELGFGMDVLESRTFSWGVVARMDAFASTARFFTIGPRMTWRWGFF